MSRSTESPSFRATTHTHPPLFLVSLSPGVARLIRHGLSSVMDCFATRVDYKAVPRASITLGKCRCLRRFILVGGTHTTMCIQKSGDSSSESVFFLPLCRTWGPNCHRAPLPAESSLWPCFIYFMHAVNTQHGYHPLEHTDKF